MFQYIICFYFTYIVIHPENKKVFERYLKNVFKILSNSYIIHVFLYKTSLFHDPTLHIKSEQIGHGYVVDLDVVLFVFTLICHYYIISRE